MQPRCFALAVFLLTAGSAVAAVSPPAPVALARTEVRSLRAKANDVVYELRVGLPRGYAEQAKRYPVVYLLDAEYSFPLAKSIADHLGERDDLPEVILVGVAYAGPERYRENRTRDYTPRHVAQLPPGFGHQQSYQKVSGGGGAFRRFLAEELVPFVDREYRTVPGDRTLVGHSYGGLFAAWCLVDAPQIFSRYLVVSPSLWYEDGFLLRAAASAEGPRRASPARVFLAVGARENPIMARDLTTFAERVGGGEKPRAVLRREVYEGETHNSVFPTALSTGLRYLFEAR